MEKYNTRLKSTTCIKGIGRVLENTTVFSTDSRRTIQEYPKRKMMKNYLPESEENVYFLLKLPKLKINVYFLLKLDTTLLYNQYTREPEYGRSVGKGQKLRQADLEKLTVRHLKRYAVCSQRALIIKRF